MGKSDGVEHLITDASAFALLFPLAKPAKNLRASVIFVFLTPSLVLTSFPLISFFYSRIPPGVHYILLSCLLRVLLVLSVSQTFLVFGNISSFEEYSSCILSDALQ